MSHLTVPKVECIESKDNFGRFSIEPLAKGFGITLGNALRRVMLSHLQGAAVTKVKIDGIQHEFSAIPDVREDVMEFILNVRALRFKPLSGRSDKLILEVAGERRVSAADIKPSADFEIANPELYLATLDSPEAKLYAELDVELGSGYGEAGPSDNLMVGVIPVDAIFTPTRKVNFTIEPIHIGQETSHERLYLEVWTDGTISPADAISHGAEILVEQLSPFRNYTPISQIEEAKAPGHLSIPEELYNMPVEQMNLSVRTLNCLRRGSITLLGELVSKTEKELMDLRNFGQKSKQEINDHLEALGLSLASSDKEKEEEAEPTEPEETVALATRRRRAR